MSTAKSMAAQYLTVKRQAQGTSAKGSTLQAGNRFRAASKLRPSAKSSSMSNLLAGGSGDSSANASGGHSSQSRTLQRPASRNALDSIHNGMNAKYASIQSKVLLQNIRPQAASTNPQVAVNARSPGAGSPMARGRAAGGLSPARGSPAKGATIMNDRAVLQTKLKLAQEETERLQQSLTNLQSELERERSDKNEQIVQLKQELELKLQEHDKQNEQYHQKLLEAYELADQNRRAADTVLSESRQREDESRKKLEELETQLNDLKEFVSMKEEMNGKLYELKEQLRQERDRYEEQLKSLHQVFENEKISQQKGPSQRLDNNSNYFNRSKPTLNSTESINKLSKSHRSEQDIYGSKLSTRMHDTAKNAWRVSKQFASSVITSGVSLSACRHRSAMKVAKKKQSDQKSDLKHQNQPQVTTEQPKSCGSATEAAPSVGESWEPHTSVIEVGSRGDFEAGGSGEHHGDRLISVDQNNKLTIVTKFNGSEAVQSQGPSASPSSDACAPSLLVSSDTGERSRCESSSSGRGTSQSSDAGSAASQNGDEEPKKAGSMKRHKRKASLFKASKQILGGSQASLSKLKGFFVAMGPTQSVGPDSPSKQQQQADQLEIARLRCMELNQAIKVPSKCFECNDSELGQGKVSAAKDELESDTNIKEMKKYDKDNYKDTTLEEEPKATKLEIRLERAAPVIATQ